ncbi:hypothetical protein RJT34_21553 [Clitoria ternatea]|uniref:Uncharacterized protein n=1 Tax=Clitoria ternatea TaxID=43366 RepID=A0AAN9IUC1_CLITE
MLNLKRGREEFDDLSYSKKRMLQFTDSDFQVLQLNQYGSNIFPISFEVEEAGHIMPSINHEDPKLELSRDSCSYDSEGTWVPQKKIQDLPFVCGNQGAN